MNDFLKQFVMKAIRKMVESGSVSEWQVREYALNWYAKGVLTEVDLKEIDDMYKQPEEAEQLDTEVNSSAEEQSATNEEENVAETEE